MTVTGGVLLYQKMQSIHGKNTGYVAAHLHLSKLMPANRQSHYIRIAATTFDPIVLKNTASAVYVIANKDIVFVGSNIDRQNLHDTIYKVRYLFGEDPIAKSEKDFFTIHNLEASFASFFKISEKIYNQEGGDQALKKAASRVNEKGMIEAAPPKKFCTAKMLSSIESAVRKADISTLMRNKPVCAVVAGGPPQVIFYEKMVVMIELVEAIAPGIDFEQNTWFSQYFRDIINERAMVNIGSADNIEAHGAFSINISLRGILNQIFQDFDRLLGDYPRQNVIIEVASMDVFSHVHDFFIAQDILSKKGYMLCLDGVSPAALPLLGLKNIDVDFIKIIWDKNAIKTRLQDFVTGVRYAIKKYGASNVIMTSCNKEDAVVFGQKMGLYLFQGKYVDKLVSSYG